MDAANTERAAMGIITKEQHLLGFARLLFENALLVLLGHFLAEKILEMRRFNLNIDII